MKKIFLFIALSTSIGLSSFAQTNDSPVRERGNRFARELNLSDEQQTKIEALNSEYRAKFEELRDNKSLTKEERSTKRKELSEQKQSAVKQVLTPEQQAKLDTRKEAFAKRRIEARSHRGDKNRSSRRGDRKDSFSEKLNLTPEQKKKFEELNKEYRVQAKDLAEKRKEAVNEILTPEQQALLKEKRESSDRPKFAKNGRKHSSKGQRGQYQRFAHKDKKRDYKLTPETIAKLDALEDNYFQEKQSIKRSRIAPEMQEKKITDLRKKYREDRQKLVRENRKSGIEV